MEMIDDRFKEARRRARRYEHPHLEYPAYARNGRLSEVHDLADDPTLPLTGPADQKPKRFDWDRVILAACGLAAVALFFIEP